MRSWLIVALLLAGTVAAQAQSTNPRDLKPGIFLVADKDLPDPYFARTVVLLVSYDAGGAIGLIVNRESKLPLSKVMGELYEDRTEAMLFGGGPVSVSGLFALVRSKRKIEKGVLAFADVYMVSAKDLGSSQWTPLRVFSGYCGWGPRQLDQEVEGGSWHLMPAATEAIFEQNPASLWQQLFDKTRMRLVRPYPSFPLQNDLPPQSLFAAR